VLSLQVQGILNTGSIPAEAPVAALMVVQHEGTPLLLAATEAGGGLASFTLTSAALAQPQSWQPYSGGGGRSGVELLTLSQGSDNRVMAVGPGILYIDPSHDEVDNFGDLRTKFF